LYSGPSVQCRQGSRATSGGLVGSRADRCIKPLSRRVNISMLLNVKLGWDKEACPCPFLAICEPVVFRASGGTVASTVEDHQKDCQ
jgi:hypothetical protein